MHVHQNPHEDSLQCHSTTMGVMSCLRFLPGDLIDLPVVHGVEHGRVAHPVAYPQFDAYPCVQKQHGSQRQHKQSHHDEGGVHLPVGQRVPTLLTAHVVVIVQEIVLHLKMAGRKSPN